MKIMMWGIILFITYNVIPNYYCWFVWNKSTKYLRGSKDIALTFDDGPDRDYTPKLLDLLKEYDVKATFFVVANKAVKNKDIFIRMIEEGHTVGLHSLKHKSAWLSLPWETSYDFEKSKDLLNEHGIQVEYFRPPWGKFNLLTKYKATKLKLKTVLWTISAKDWSKYTTDEYIKKQILKQLNNGGIIVLHDSNGAEGAPLRTISALESTIPIIKEKGYRFVTIDEKLEGVSHEKAC